MRSSLVTFPFDHGCAKSLDRVISSVWILGLLGIQILCVGTTVTERKVSATTEPLLLRAVKGEVVDRPPVWLMRQAGRYMKASKLPFLICLQAPNVICFVSIGM